MTDAMIKVTVDKDLLLQVMTETGSDDQQAAIEASLRATLQRKAAQRLAGMGGKYKFHEGFLEEEIAGRI